MATWMEERVEHFGAETEKEFKEKLKELYKKHPDGWHYQSRYNSEDNGYRGEFCWNVDMTDVEY